MRNIMKCFSLYFFLYDFVYNVMSSLYWLIKFNSEVVFSYGFHLTCVVVSSLQPRVTCKIQVGCLFFAFYIFSFVSVLFFSVQEKKIPFFSFSVFYTLQFSSLRF